MLSINNYSKKHCPVGENIFLNLAAECLFNYGLFYPQKFSWRQPRYISSQTWLAKEHKVYHLQWIICFEL